MLACRAGGRHGRGALACEEACGDRRAAFAAASAAGMVECAQAVGALMAVAGLLALAWYRHVALSRFGGVTGDLAGWFLQWAELAMLTMLVVGGMLL